MDLLETLRNHPEFFRNRAFDTRSFPLPLSDPRAPPVKSKRYESSSGHEFFNLRLPRCCFHAGPEIIIDHNPTIIGQQIAVAVQVSTHVAVRIKDKEADLVTAQNLPDG